MMAARKDSDAHIERERHRKEARLEQEFHEHLGQAIPVQHELYEAPDGGCWAWVVCMTSFLTNGIIFGILNTFGILYVGLLQEFDDGSGESIAFKTCKLMYYNVPEFE